MTLGFGASTGTGRGPGGRGPGAGGTDYATAQRILLLIVLTVAAFLVGSSGHTADAHGCPATYPWTSEYDMTHYRSVNYGCERNFVTDPGHGEVLEANSTGPRGLLRPDRVDFFGSHGFSPNFLWYAPRTTMQVGPSDNRNWAACKVAVPAGGICPEVKHGPIAPSFSQNATLQIIGDGDNFIALACGNFSAAGPSPTPYLEGYKFRDDNRNGVRDPDEPGLEGWEITITREFSSVGQGAFTARRTTGPNGYYRFDLDGHGPGRYEVRETLRSGWRNHTDAVQYVDVGFGVGSRGYRVDFGNAETDADVAKTAMAVVNPPAQLDVDTPTDLTVSVTLVNRGPAQLVSVRDELVAVLPEDCSTPEPRRTFTETLRRGEPVARQLVFRVTCTRPSEHVFEFQDELFVTTPGVSDPNPTNNRRSTSSAIPVHAYTDLATSAVLRCAERTDVGVAADCEVDVTVTNDGFGPVDATASVELSLPPDCSADPAMATLRYPGLADGGAVTLLQRFAVTCTYRSFHDITVSSTVTADDPHVFELDQANDTGADGPRTMEVFHDASMAVIDLHLTCDETVGATAFTCGADVVYVKTGPAPDVDVALTATLGDLGDCTTEPAAAQTQTFVLDGDTPQQRRFEWSLSCPAADTLRPFSVVADIAPTEREPHAVDQPGPVTEHWVVPYCLPTVNPHGQREPQAPGTGMNEDGFYVFGTLSTGDPQQVTVRDDGSGTEFGPFPDGTRIKWVEANGAEPSIRPMGGNNGNGGGQSEAVDYQIRGQGDAEAVFVDEKGVEIVVTCLVPPFPK